MKYTIFTDGSSRGNPGPGGWAAVIIKNGKFAHTSGVEEAWVKELGGAEPNTTNNRMELMAAIQAMSHVAAHPGREDEGPIVVFTDSSYLINGITKWIHGWMRNGWRTKTKEDVLNKDLWIRLADVLSDRKADWVYVGGHSGIKGNERCDEIATAFADARKVQLYDGPLAGYPHPDVLDTEPDAQKLREKKSVKARSNAKAHSYVSMVEGRIEIHKDWSSCENRVKGKRGARYRKALDPQEESAIVEEFRKNS